MQPDVPTMHGSTHGSVHSCRLLSTLLCALLLVPGPAGSAGSAGSTGSAEMQSSEQLSRRDAEMQSSEQLSRRALRDFYPKGPNLTSEKQLLGALQDVLEKLQAKRLPLWEKKFGQVPTCDVGEQCAVRKGARIGKMCDCPRGAFCNFFLLKCL